MREAFIIALIIIGSISFTPVFAANANLFVSAENSQFDNYMSGPQVIEVVVIDSDVNDTDEAKGEPDVTVNGKILRMVQAVDGNWYGYFADRNQTQIADSTSNVDGEGLDFGSFCGPDSTFVLNGTQAISVSDTQGIAIPGTAIGSIDGTNPPTVPLASCTSVISADTSMNVLRETKTVNENVVDFGQIGINSDAWPFIQLYPLNPTGNVVVQYNKGGGAQTTTLTFDTVNQFAGLETDRLFYKKGTDVLVTISDPWLNIDPTDEDSWTFGTVGTNSTNYQVFDENGHQDGDGVGGIIDIIPALGDLMCPNSCVLTINPNVQETGFVITLQDNNDSEIRSNLGPLQNPTSWETLGNALSGNVPITITEVGPNSGVFFSYDEVQTSNIITTDNPDEGSTASFVYNQNEVTITIFQTGNVVVFKAGSSGINCNDTDSCLNPGSSTIFPSEGVTWFNADIAIHEVVSGNPTDGPDGLFDSGFISPGNSFSFNFTSPGEFAYYDIIHPWLVGVVFVTDLTPPPDTDILIPLDGHNATCQSSDTCYVPSSFSIDKDTDVKWFNSDMIAHKVESGTFENGTDGKFSSGSIQPGQEFIHTFNEVGTFPYFDPLHTWATGEIIVNRVFPPGIDVLILMGSSVSGCQFNDSCITPTNFTANLGDTVTWLNEDDAGHTITSGTPGGGHDGEFDSGLIFAGGNFSNSFSEDGVFPYYDVIHPWAVGSVTVNPQDCIVPSNGVWSITQNCKLISNATTPANVLVQNNSTLTIPSGITLTIPSGQNIIVESGSGMLVKDGGTLKVIG